MKTDHEHHTVAIKHNNRSKMLYTLKVTTHGKQSYFKCFLSVLFIFQGTGGSCKDNTAHVRHNTVPNMAELTLEHQASSAECTSVSPG